jgi:hypothetical protein
LRNTVLLDGVELFEGRETFSAGTAAAVLSIGGDNLSIGSTSTELSEASALQVIVQANDTAKTVKDTFGDNTYIGPETA